MRRSWLLLTVLLGLPCWAQDAPTGPAQERPPYWRTNLFRRVIADQKFLVTRWFPSEFRHPEFTVPLVLATATAAGAHDPSEPSFDFSVADRIDQGTEGRGDRIAGHLTTLGNAATMAVVLGTTYLAGRKVGNDRLARASSLSAEALLDAAIWFELLKATTARMRPNQPNEGSFFEYGQPENGSFPSGHAAGAFTVATVFAEEYRDQRWVPWVAYGTATLIGTSRIALGRHFPSDVVVGSILGYSMGRAVATRAREVESGRREADRIAVLVDPSRGGYVVCYSHGW